jgi:hypothetical protein
VCRARQDRKRKEPELKREICRSQPSIRRYFYSRFSALRRRKLLNRFNLTARRANHQIPVQPHLQKYFCFILTQISSLSRTVPSHRGALRNVINAERDAVDAGSMLDESC